MIFVLFSLITDKMIADTIACPVFHFSPRRDSGAISFASVSQFYIQNFSEYNVSIRELNVLLGRIFVGKVSNDS